MRACVHTCPVSVSAVCRVVYTSVRMSDGVTHGTVTGCAASASHCANTPSLTEHKTVRYVSQNLSTRRAVSNAADHTVFVPRTE